MRVLVIDDSPEFRSRVTQYLAAAMPDAALTLWDPATQGRPAVGFDWRRYDVLLLDDVPGAGADGLAWLNEFRTEGHVPPMLVLSETGGEDMAVKAVKAGAADYLKKPDLTPIRLAMAIKEAMIESVEISREMLRSTQSLKVGEIGQPAGADQVGVSGYRVLRKIGEGGMLRVYLAERESDGIQLVLKMLDTRLAGDPQSQARFVREYKIIQRLQNEHVVMIFDQGFSAENPWLAMEYFPGGDLSERIEKGISSMGALKILVQTSRSTVRSTSSWRPSTTCKRPGSGTRTRSLSSRLSPRRSRA